MDKRNGYVIGWGGAGAANRRAGGGQRESNTESSHSSPHLQTAIVNHDSKLNIIFNH
jgi:hypothetical protein